jgi:Cys-tRNA(Pro) deacylase
MGRKTHPVTPAIRALRGAEIPFTVHLYKYEQNGGAQQAAEELSLEERAVIKTLVFQNEKENGLLILMHGDMQVSAKKLARQLQLKKAEPCDQRLAMKLTGYKLRGISPFGTRTPLPVYVELSIFDLEKIYIKGGKHASLPCTACKVPSQRPGSGKRIV